MAEPTTARPKGVYVATLTALAEDLSVDTRATVDHYRWLLDEGCDGIVCLGTTGEANSLSLDERLGLLDALGETDLPAKTVVGTGCCALPDTVRLTKKALDIGAAGVLVLPPFYYKGVSEDGLYAAFAETIERVGDDRLRLYLYHFPRMTNIDMSLDLIGRLIDAYPKTVVGIKNSSGDWPNMEAQIDAFPGFDVFPGSEEFLLPALRKGAPGCMSATLNVLAPQTAELYARWREGDADALQERLTALRQTISQAPPIPTMKALLAERSGRAAWRQVRPPLRPVTAEQARKVRADLEAMGLSLPKAA